MITYILFTFVPHRTHQLFFFSDLLFSMSLRLSGFLFACFVFCLIIMKSSQVIPQQHQPPLDTSKAHFPVASSRRFLSQTFLVFLFSSGCLRLLCFPFINSLRTHMISLRHGFPIFTSFLIYSVLEVHILQQIPKKRCSQTKLRFTCLCAVKPISLTPGCGEAKCRAPTKKSR